MVPSQSASITRMLSFHLHRRSVEMGAYRSGKDANSPNTCMFGPAFDVRRQLHEPLWVRLNFLSCFLPCQILSASNQQPARSSYIKCPQRLHGVGQNPTLGLLVYVCATVLGVDVIVHATTANQRGEMTVILAALHHPHHTNGRTSSIQTCPQRILMLCWRACYGLQRRWRGSWGWMNRRSRA